MKIKWKICLINLLCALLINGSATLQASSESINKKVVKITKKSVTQKELLEHLEFLTSEQLAGRPTGNWDTGISLETIIATDYLKQKCFNWKLQPAGDKQSPNQHFRTENYRGAVDSLNVAFYVPGTKFAKEFIVLVAHYDHLGYRENRIYFGANDNASGVSALLELAQVFSDLYNKGIKPERSIIFLFVGAEESGLCGSAHYATNFSLEGEIVTAISLDMVGVPDIPESFNLNACPSTEEAPKRIPEIFAYMQKWKDTFGFRKINLPAYGYFRSSDHYPFWGSSPADNRIPSFLIIAGEDDEYYHTIGDTLRDKKGNLRIDLNYLERLTEFVTILVLEIANGPKPDYVEELN